MRQRVYGLCKPCIGPSFCEHLVSNSERKLEAKRMRLMVSLERKGSERKAEKKRRVRGQLVDEGIECSERAHPRYFPP